MIIKDEEILKNELKNKSNTKLINFIPTMGNLHEGHLSLLRFAKKNNHLSVVSIFVNPLQFDDTNDFKSYPKTLKKDLNLLNKLKADIVFVPKRGFVKFNNILNYKDKLFSKLCGNNRPGHFLGVVTVMYKLLRLIEPDIITLGEKDFQQVLIIKKLLKKNSMNIKVSMRPTIREDSGLALSSRNSLLSKINFNLAKLIFKTLNMILSEIEKNKFNQERLFFYHKKIIDYGFESVDYLKILKEKNLEELDQSPSRCRIFVAARIDGVRLIDNLPIRVKLTKKNCNFHIFN